MRYLIPLCLAVGLVGPATAADPPKLPKELALVPRDALGVVSLDVAAVADHPAFRGLRESLTASAANDEVAAFVGLRCEDVARYTAVLIAPRGPDQPRHVEPDVVLLVTTRKPLDKGRVVQAAGLYGIDEAKEALGTYRPVGKRPEPSGKADAAFFVGLGGRVVAFADDRTLVLWPTHGRIEKVADTPNPLALLKSNAETGPLTVGLALAAKHPLAGAANLAGLRQAYRNDPPTDNFVPLMKADQFYGHAALTKNAVELSVTAEFAGQQWAADGQEAAEALRTLAIVTMKFDVDDANRRGEPGSTEVQFTKLLLDTLQMADLKRSDNTVTLTGRFALGAKAQAVLAALPGGTTEAVNQTKGVNNLKQIGLAFRAYASEHGRLPTNVVGKDGKPLLSWRVQILPYLEQDHLGRQFKFDEPWDSEHNKKLIEKLPPVYALPGVKTKEAGQTYYQGFVGKKGAGLRPLFVAGESQGLTLAAVTDGLSNSFLCVEAADPVVWTKPDDLPFDPAGKLPKLGGHAKADVFQAVFCDGSVRSLSTKLPEATLKAHVTVQGGEVIPTGK